MSAKAGDIARENSIYRCEGCDQKVPVHKGVPIADCPHCGSASFQTGLAAQPRVVEAAFNGIA